MKKTAKEDQSLNGVRVVVTRFTGGSTTVDAACSCFGSEMRTHNTPNCPNRLRLLKQQELSDAIYAALRDWRSGRAYAHNSGAFFVMNVTNYGGPCMVEKSSSGRKAWWSDAARAWFGDSHRLHVAAHEFFPKPELSAFERLHNLDHVAQDLLRESDATDHGEIR